MTLDLEVKVKVTQILSGRRGVCYTYICQYCITTVIYMSQKWLMQAAGFSAVPAVFLVNVSQHKFSVCTCMFSSWQHILFHSVVQWNNIINYIWVWKHQGSTVTRATFYMGLDQTPMQLLNIRLSYICRDDAVM